LYDKYFLEKQEEGGNSLYCSQLTLLWCGCSSTPSKGVTVFPFPTLLCSIRDNFIEFNKYEMQQAMQIWKDEKSGEEVRLISYFQYIAVDDDTIFCPKFDILPMQRLR